jgi:hypothetical protein
VRTLILKNEENYHRPTLKFIVDAWRKWTRHRRQCYRILSVAISKSLMFNGFVGIRQ